MSQLELKIEPLTAESFAPYGFVIGAKDARPDFVNTTGTRGWEYPFKGGQLRMFLLETAPRALVFDKLEKHTELSQVFMPAGGSSAVLLVARAPDEQSLPDKDDVRAFLLDGQVGYGLHPHTWHSLDRLPLDPHPTRWLMLTDDRTHNDLPYVSTGTAQYTKEFDTVVQWGVQLTV